MTTQRLRTIALVEAVSWMVMLAAVAAKRLFGHAGAVTVMGPVHGVIFLGYAAAVLAMRDQLRWDGRKTIVALCSAVIPLGTYLVVERRFLSDEKQPVATQP